MSGFGEPWDALVRGEWAGVRGPIGRSPAGLPLRPVVVRCGGERALGPLHRARSELADRAGPYDLLGATGRLRRGLRRRLLGDEVDDLPALFAELRELAGRVDGALLVLDGVERADEDTLRALRRAQVAPGGLGMPVLCVFGAPPTGPAAELATALGLALDGGSAPPPDPETAWTGLAPEVWLVLRALAHGPATPDTLAERVDRSVLSVLAALQQALDAGVPIDDRGMDGFALPPDHAAALRRTTLPALSARWSASESAPAAQPEAHAELPFALDPAADAAQEPLRQASVDAGSHEPEPVPEPEPEPAAGPWPDLPGSGIDALPSEAPAADEADLAVARLAVAAHEAFAHEDLGRALGLGVTALRALERLPVTEARRHMRIGLLADLALYRRATQDDRALLEARDLAVAARDLLRPGDPHRLAASVFVSCARVHGDLGDPRSLDTALDALTDAIRLLQEAGEPLEAARLLNDQAEVWLRLGDPVRASHLLRTSRDVFEGRAHDDVEARIEMAETDHLLARMPFHVGARPLAADAVWDAALSQLRPAEQTYRELQMPRELGRVLETRGRLECRAGRCSVALETLREAFALQQRHRDVLGLARTSGALAEALVGAGRTREALALLAQSIRSNVQAGSRLGLVSNREALEALSAKVRDDRSAFAGLTEVARMLDGAERALGGVERASSSGV